MDLLVGANVVWTRTTAPGSGFTQRVITSPDGDIAQDRVVTARTTRHALFKRYGWIAGAAVAVLLLVIWSARAQLQGALEQLGRSLA